MSKQYCNKILVLFLVLLTPWTNAFMFSQIETMGIQADSCLNYQEVGVRLISIQDYSSRGQIDALNLYVDYDQEGLEFRGLDQNVPGLLLTTETNQPGALLIKKSQQIPFGSSELSEETLVVSLFFRCINCGGYSSEIRLNPDSSWIAFENADTLFFGGEGIVETICPDYATIESDTTLCAGASWEGEEITENTTVVLENSDDCGCPKKELVHIDVVDLPGWNYSQEALDCDEGISLLSLFDTDGIDIEQVLWEDGTEGVFKEVVGKGSMEASIAFSNGCNSEELIEWVGAGDIQAEVFIEDISGAVRLTAETTDPPDLFDFQWSNGEFGNTIEVIESGDYEVTITDIFGCYRAFSVEVEVEPGIGFFIPNAFSPNGDGTNDYWGVYFADEDATIEVVRIFDTWGSVIFERRNISASNATELWDGYHSDTNEIITGPVVYQIVLVEDGREVFHKGVITVVK